MLYIRFKGGSGLVFAACFVSLSLRAVAVEVRPEPNAFPATSTMAKPVFQKQVKLEALPARTTAGQSDRVSAPQERKRGDLEVVLTEAKCRLQIGMRRDFTSPEVISPKYTPPADWTILPDGSRLWAANVMAEGAKGLRLHLRDIVLPHGATLLVYSPDSSLAAGVVEASQVEEAKEVWMPTVLSSNMIFECRVPGEVDLAKVEFTLDGVSHLYESPTPSLAKAGSCNNDVSCESGWRNAAAGVARITFVEGGNTYLCSGALLANHSSSAAAYFLTANHCVNSQTVASTLELYWLFQTDSCGGTAPSLSEVPRTAGGADLVAGSGANDFSLLRLRRAPPSGVFYLLWSADAPAPGEAVATIHHPGGSYKKISFGAISSASASFERVKWSSGVTEPGSSGAPLLNARQEIVGQLYGGSSSCGNPSGVDTFGRFDVTYQAVKSWLEPGVSPAPPPTVAIPAGSYSGYFERPGGFSANTSGLLNLKTGSGNRFTGAIRMTTGVHAFTGRFDRLGHAAVAVRRGNWPSLMLDLQVNPSDPSRISGSIGDSSWNSELQANRATYNGTTRIAPQAGRYTIAFPEAGLGDGIGLCTIRKSGLATFTGKLPSGLAWSGSGYISAEGDFPMFAAASGGRQAIGGWIRFGAGYWSSPGGTLVWSREGLNLQLHIEGSKYVTPPASEPVLIAASVAVTFSGEALDATFALPMGPKRQMYGANDQAEKISIIFGDSGVFSGNVAGLIAGRRVPFRGVVLQNSGNGYGYFAGSGTGGAVRISSQ